MSPRPPGARSRRPGRAGRHRRPRRGHGDRRPPRRAGLGRAGRGRAGHLRHPRAGTAVARDHQPAGCGPCGLAVRRPGPRRLGGRRRGPGRSLLAGPRSFCAGVERAIETVERALEPLRRPGLRPPPDRPQPPRGGAARSPRARCSCTSSTRFPTGPRWCSRPTAWPRRCAPRPPPRPCRSSTPPARWWPRSTTRCAASTAAGYQVVLIGHAGHDETEGTLGEAERHHPRRERRATWPPSTWPTPTGWPTSPRPPSPPTTSPVWCRALSERVPRHRRAVAPPTSVTPPRTARTRCGPSPAACDLMLVVGSPNSSNTARLVEVADRAGCRAELVEDEIGAASWTGCAGASTIGVTAGASAPPVLVERVVDRPGRRSARSRSRSEPCAPRHVNFPLPLEVR